MYTFLNKYGQALAFGIGVLITVIFLAAIFSADDTTRELLLANDKSPEAYDTGIFDFGITISVVLIGLAFLVAIIFGVVQMIDNPKGSLKGIAGLVALVLIMFIGYSMASGEVNDPEIANAITKFETSQEASISPGNLKFISGSIVTALIMLALAVLTLVVFGIRGLFK
ncbi:hypothetical protein LEM8419_02578 [Neolewinella maritima]|uniref:DUF4064 domain-containing protein n=1 Tax=Neolewinella maritima TaxID=1383882 RepID=A0ABM9B2V3_9BACT|nr:hypothetical protein [Neolewinella maritima]CAH1001672.1 hypothetical protein LEM8419_02578 [Neolewinella maritima]